jgi:NDP-sugar pyrophosphorylase family protein
MKAMILAAGEGTRLRPLTTVRPKPMLPLAGRPLLDYTLDLLALSGVEEAIVNLHHAAAALEQALRAHPHPLVRLTLSHEPELLGTAGAVRRVADQLTETFFLIYGDNLADVDLDALLHFHRQHGAAATLGLFPAPPCAAVGRVDCDPDGRVRAFQEKPERASGGAANAGIYVLEPAVLSYIPDDRPSDWGHEIFPALLRAGAPVMARFVQGHLRDTGTPAGYLRAHRDLLAGRLPRLWRPEHHDFERFRDRAWAHASATIAEPGDVHGPALLGPRSLIARGARVGRGSVLGASVCMETGARVTGAVLWEGSRIAAEATVDRAIVGAGCRLEAGCYVMQDSIIGDESVIRAGAVVAPGTRVPAGVIWT